MTDNMSERIQRVNEMEARLDRVSAWLENHAAPSDDIANDALLLGNYLESELWRSDFEADEAGAFPAELRRGVLSEDGIYNTLEEYRERMKEIAFADAVAAIRPGRYRHFKGNEYEVIGIARHSETEEPMVVYKALYGNHDLWTRPAAMWNETVEQDGKTCLRFVKVKE